MLSATFINLLITVDERTNAGVNSRVMIVKIINVLFFLEIIDTKPISRYSNNHTPKKPIATYLRMSSIPLSLSI